MYLLKPVATGQFTGNVHSTTQHRKLLSFPPISSAPSLFHSNQMLEEEAIRGFVQAGCPSSETFWFRSSHQQATLYEYTCISQQIQNSNCFKQFCNPYLTTTFRNSTRFSQICVTTAIFTCSLDTEREQSKMTVHPTHQSRIQEHPNNNNTGLKNHTLHETTACHKQFFQNTDMMTLQEHCKNL